MKQSTRNDRYGFLAGAILSFLLDGVCLFFFALKQDFVLVLGMVFFSGLLVRNVRKMASLTRLLQDSDRQLSQNK